MSYEDALERCLQAISDGEDLDAVLRAFPEHETRLREDVALSRRVDAFARTLPPASPERTADALAHLRSEVEAQRRGRIVPSRPPRGGFFAGLSLGVRTMAMVTAAVVIAVVAFSVLGGSLSKNEALAAEIEGIVVETSDTALVVQTQDAVESVEIGPGALISDEAGTAVPVTGIEIGQLVQVRGQRLSEGRFLAKLIAKRNVAAIGAWCREQLSRCQQIERQQLRRAAECNDGPACERLRARLQELGAQIRLVVRLEDLSERCRAGDNAACRERRLICADQGQLCRRMERIANQ